MSANGNVWQRSLQAAESAGRLLDELGVDTSRQIDVFSMCEDLDLWLAFLPMDGLLGAFVPEGTGGILITDRRPITVQRYTAAHELGHWRLEHGHGLALDGEEHVFGADPAERERLAQMFAANLLMPPPLILGLLARIGVSGGDTVKADQAYFVAREAGVSYEAAVRQLSNLQVISTAVATSLLDVRPMAIKSQIAGGRRPVYGYADVWPVDERWNDQLVSLRVDDEIVVSLPENRSTGYRWMFEDEVVEVEVSPEPPPLAEPDLGAKIAFQSLPQVDQLDEPVKALKAAPARGPSALAEEASSPEIRMLPDGAAFVGDEYLPGRGSLLRGNAARLARRSVSRGDTHSSNRDSQSPDRTTSARSTGSLDESVLIGATGRRLLGIRYLEPGPKTLRLQYRSPYSNEESIEKYTLRALVEARRQRFSIDQLIENQGESWLSEVRGRNVAEPTDYTNEPESD